jgi:hypothetical protein
MKTCNRITLSRAAIGIAAALVMSALPITRAYADGNSGVFQPNDDQFGAGWQVLQAPAAPAPVAAPVASTPVAEPLPAAPVAAPLAAVPVPAPVPSAPVAAPLPEGPAATPLAAAPFEAAPMLAPVPPSPATAMAAATKPTRPPILLASTQPVGLASDSVTIASSLSRGEAVVPVAPDEGHTFDLQAGVSLEQQLQTWAQDAGWTLSWNLLDDWIVPGNSSYGTDFAQAAQRVIEQAAQNGADIRADLYPGNRSLVVHQAGALR